MTKKRILITILSVVLAVIAIIAVFSIFTLKKIDLVFTGNTRAESESLSVYEKLESFTGKNLLFLDIKEVENTVNNDPYFEVESVIKKFPDGVEVKLKERREIFVFSFEDKSYVTSEEGYVLREFTGEKDRTKIALSFSDISVTDVKIGEKLVTDYDTAVYNALSLARLIELTDCVDSIKVEKKASTTEIGSYQTIVTFNTYTAVEIIIYDAENNGNEKTAAAFYAYDNEESDYKKTNNKIEAFAMTDGTIRVIWANE